MIVKRPSTLKSRDKVAIITHRSGLPDLFPWVYEQRLNRIAQVFDLVPVEYPTARQTSDYLSKKSKSPSR